MGNHLQTELQSLNCPTTNEQEKKWKMLFNKLNANNNIQIDKLLSDLGFKLLKTELNDQTINPYYKLTVLTKDKLKTELYLRINDPHPFNEYKVITNKVTIINCLKNNTKIPVETILSYSNDCKTSLIETEYILTEKLNGLPLNQVFKTADQIPDSLIKEILSIYSELKSIRLDLDIQKIGYFDKDMKNISNSLTNKLENSLTITNYFEYFNKELNWILSEMKKISQFSKLAQQLELIQQAIYQINENNLDLDKMNFNDQMSIYHSKFNADNILVDPVTFKVTEIIGWENAYYGFDDNQVDLLLFENDRFDGIEKTKLMKRFVNILDTLDWYKQPTGKIVRSYLSDLLNKSRILVFYFSTWFKVHKCSVDDHLNYQLPFLVHHLRAIDVFLSILKDYKNTNTTLNIITNEEFEALQSPSCKKQNDEMTKIIESLNDTKLKLLAESIGLKFIKGEIFKQKNGIVNSIFLITVEENKEVKKLFLKISDTHPIFKNKKTLNEVSILKYLHNKIPVPEVLSFSNDSSSSLIHCEYILMSSAKGTLLKELFDLKDFKDINKMPNVLIENMLDLIKQIESIKLSGCQKISGFDLSMSLRQPIVRFGPWIEACSNFLEFLDKNLIWTINEMNKIKSFKKLANDLDLFRLELIKVVENNNDLDNLNFKDEMNICHSDLHPGNIFVDPNTFKVSSLIDWEWCHYG